MPEPKSSHSLDALLDEVRLLGQEQYELVQAICAIIKKKVKPFTEEVKYGGILFSSGIQFCGVFAYTGHVSLEFGSGAKIVDAIFTFSTSGRKK
jgi:hypothetical protein